MKKITIVIALFTFYTAAKAQDSLQFTTVKELKITPVKNQSRTGTCWCFSGTGLLEAELLRTGKGECDLSEMFTVNKVYLEKADRYVRLHGHLNYAQGGSFHDVLFVLKNYGVVPEEVYHGIEYGDTVHSHGEMEQGSAAFLKALIDKPGGKLSPVWKTAHKAIIETYLGKAPETFTYQGKEYTPKSYAASLGLDADNYVSLTSFTHKPYYTAFAIEIPDNWQWAESWNLPLGELMSALDNAIEKGYTVAWGADVSEKGFTRNGLATLDGKTMEDITPELRQQGYDNYETTDDHGMLIYGTAKDQNGEKYYLVKNSWGTTSKYKGVWYASAPFVAYKTINIVLHKDAVPKDILKKLNIR